MLGVLSMHFKLTCTPDTPPSRYHTIAQYHTIVGALAPSAVPCPVPSQLYTNFEALAPNFAPSCCVFLPSQMEASLGVLDLFPHFCSSNCRSLCSYVTHFQVLWAYRKVQRMGIEKVHIIQTVGSLRLLAFCKMTLLASFVNSRVLSTVQGGNSQLLHSVALQPEAVGTADTPCWK